LGDIKDKTTWEGRADQNMTTMMKKTYNNWEIRGFNDLFVGDSGCRQSNAV